MRILVTGGAGFIGSHIARAAAASGQDVVVLDDLSTGRADHVAGMRLLCGDVRDDDDVRRALRSVDIVCHQAAKVGLESGVEDLPDYVSRNDLGTAVLLRGMTEAGVRRLVLASSMVVYGEGAYRCPVDGPVSAPPREAMALAAGRFEPACPDCGRALAWTTLDETAPLDPRNAYAVTKVTQEHLTAAWARATGGAAVALRYHNVYGPLMPTNTPYAGVGALFRSALLRGEAPRVFEDGGQRRDFVHVRDVAAANLHAVHALGSGDVAGLATYNVASGDPRTVLDLATALADALGGPRPVVTGQYRLGDVRHIVASAQRAGAVLGFRAAVRFEDGVAELAAEGRPRDVRTWT